MRVGEKIELPDGTTVQYYDYGNGRTARKYKPVAAKDRKYQGPKYSGEPGFYFGYKWYPPYTELLPDDDRKMPETIPDFYIYLHMYLCPCRICARPGALWWKRLKNRRGTKLSMAELDRLQGPCRSALLPRSAETEE